MWYIQKAVVTESHIVIAHYGQARRLGGRRRKGELIQNYYIYVHNSCLNSSDSNNKYLSEDRDIAASDHMVPRVMVG